MRFKLQAKTENGWQTLSEFEELEAAEDEMEELRHKFELRIIDLTTTGSRHSATKLLN